MLKRLLPAILIASLTASPVSAATTSLGAQSIAQATTPALPASTINGAVTDNSGAPVQGAQLLMVGPGTYDATSDAKGLFTITNVKPGIYSFAVTKPGYQPVSQDELVVQPGQAQTLAVVLPALTLTSLREIGSVTSRSRATSINTRAASVNNIAAQTFVDQSQPQVMKVLNETPGIVASLPQTSANGAVAGAITFPNIRGALSFESASLIDGHPVSVGTFGDYVTTFLNSFMLQNVEVVKGPGADSPVVNYAIGGTVNFRTKEPTFKPTATVSFTTNDPGGYELDAGYSGTSANNKLSWTFDYGHITQQSAIQGYQSTFSPNGGIAGGAVPGNLVLGFNDTSTSIPGAAGKPIFGAYNLVACCQTMDGVFTNDSELAKLRYRFSNATTGTVSYLGSQTNADQNGNTSSQTLGTFGLTPLTTGYSGSIAIGSIVPVISLHPGKDTEINNEPIFQAELRSSLGNNTVLGRYYAATIDRLIYQGGDTPFSTYTTSLALNGDNGAKTTTPYNNVTMPVSFFNYFRQQELDALSGYSIEFDHPIGNNGNLLSISYDATNSTTTSSNISASPQAISGGKVSCGAPNAPAQGTLLNGTPCVSTSITLPTGSRQQFATGRIGATFNVGTKLQIEETNYFNTYKSTYPYACALTNTAPGAAGSAVPATDTSGINYGTSACKTPYNINGTGFLFGTTTTSHFDPRINFVFRPNSNLAVRLSAGSSIAPPFLADLSAITALSYRGGTTATQTVNAGNLKPETAFGVNLGADLRLKDGVTILSGDIYSTNLTNQFITSTSASGQVCTGAFGCPAGIPIINSQVVNLNRSLYQGIEFAARRSPTLGWGYTVQGALLRAYVPYVNPCFYSTTLLPSGAVNCTAFNTNLGVVPGANFSGGALGGFNGVSNQNVPYSQGYAELRYVLPHDSLVRVGATYYGPNNSLNEKAFLVESGTIRWGLPEGYSIQLSGDNLSNQYSGLFPTSGAGVFTPLAGPALFGATTANVLGPRNIRLTVTKLFDFSKSTTPTP